VELCSQEAPLFKRTLNLHQLATFQVVAKHGSFVRAAEELHLSQPAVSAHIRHLEKAVGVKLFDQIGRKTYLTPAGEELYLYSQKIFSVMVETLEAMATLRSPHYGRLSLGADTTVGTYIVPSLLGKFHQVYPEVEIFMEVLNHAALVDALVSRRIDMAVMAKVPTGIPVFSEPFVNNELVLVAPPTHSLAGRAHVPFAAVAREHFLLREPGSSTRDALETFFEEAGYPLLVSMQVGNNSAIKRSVAAGLGIALLSRSVIDMELKTNRLVILDVEGFPIVRQWHIVQLQDKNLSATAKVFKSFIMQYADQSLRGEKNSSTHDLELSPRELPQ
jgi:LysR family transcriptional regulator, low CO2-responsive transcriptional regulator